MPRKKIAAVLSLVIGAILVAASLYIQSEVSQGRQQIAGAQSTLDTTQSLFSLTPATKNVGGLFSNGIQKKINEGSELAAHYERIALLFGVAGALLLASGTYFWFQSSKK